MSKFKIINLVDKIFVSCAIFLIIYAWINFFLRDLFTSFVLSLLFSAAVLYLMFYFINKRNIKKNLTKKTLQEIEENFLAFRLLNSHNQLSLLFSIISLENKANLQKNLSFFNKNKKFLVILATKLEKLTQNDLLNLLSEHQDISVDGLMIVCNEYISNLKTNILKDKEIILINKKDLYVDYFKKHNIYPNKNNLNLQPNKEKFKDILKGFVVPQKAKSYFFCGLILIFSSIILPYHTYYIIFGSVLLLISVICKLLPIFIKR